MRRFRIAEENPGRKENDRSNKAGGGMLPFAKKRNDNNDERTSRCRRSLYRDLNDKGRERRRGREIVKRKKNKPCRRNPLGQAIFINSASS